MALSPLDLIVITIQELGGNPVRSGLTTLGIFMGVAAVNVTLNISAITHAQIQAKLADRDRPFVSPTIASTDGSFLSEEPKLNREDLAVLQREVDGISHISTVSDIYGLSNIQFQEQQISTARVKGVSENYQRTTGRTITQGRWFSAADFEQYLPVAIVDQVLSDQLFQGENPLGQGFYAGGIRFTVVGISETKTEYAGVEPAGELWIPLTYGSAVSGNTAFSSTQIAMAEIDYYKEIQDQVTEILSQRYPNFEVYVYGNGDDLYQEAQQQRISSTILNIVGLFALVIGGVGIANITVASVVERTKEIGLRRAVGATDSEVMLQFMAEVVVLSTLAGLMAIASVHFLTQAATTTLFQAPYAFSPRDAAISMGAALSVGVGSSFFPALRITQIDVVQALRGE
jgi:putative ABC transport system permease protein